LKDLQFLDLSILDIIDIFLVALLLYYVYKLVKGTVAINIFIGIVIIYLIWQLTKALDMLLLSNILGAFISVGVFALIVVFQQEIRKFLLMVGSTNLGGRNGGIVKRLRFLKENQLATETDVDAIVNACAKMATTKTGALLVLERSNKLDFVRNTGDVMNIEISQPIIESIFYKNSPLHDGAALISGNYIVATRVILPVSSERRIPSRFGLRHRAAVGISEKTDALVLVVSEETGQVSYVKDGEFMLFSDMSELALTIKKDLA
jgi:uncharacterized protein (TIGR00159 family)